MHSGLTTNNCGQSHIATGCHGLFQESANGDGKCVPETNPGKHHTFTIIIQNLLRINEVRLPFTLVRVSDTIHNGSYLPHISPLLHNSAV